MISTKYQLIIIGSDNSFSPKITDVFFQHISELGLDESKINIIKRSNFKKQYTPNAPAFCLYFGDAKGKYKDLNLLETLKSDATLILPVVNSLGSFTESVPKELYSINGYQLSSESDIEPLVGSILEGLGLLRLSRRLFISYRRKESSSIAIQLFEQFEKNGFDVFLDTHSIRPGESFQDELWHRMADADIVVLLNTPNFLKSKWTTKELARANAMSIGILQLLWPDHRIENNAQLSIPFQLENKDFASKPNSFLGDSVVEEIVSQAEGLRARSYASRQDNIVTEFISAANEAKKQVSLHHERFITLTKKNGTNVIIIPTVGVPEAFTYNQSQELVSQIELKEIEKAYILYDHRHLRKRWIEHLSWLDDHLPIKSIKIVKAGEWLKKV